MHSEIFVNRRTIFTAFVRLTRLEPMFPERDDDLSAEKISESSSFGSIGDCEETLCSKHLI